MQGPVSRHGGFGARLRPLGHVDPVLFGVLKNVALQLSLPWPGYAVDHAEVFLLQLPVLHLLVQDPQRFGGLGRYDDAAGVPVNPVAQSRGKGMLRPGLPFPLGVEVGLNVVDQGPAILRPVVGVYGHARLFVRQKEILVLIDDAQMRP